ncbi:MAG: thiamine-phosphate kinase [Pseudomonadota bacterium]
MSEFDWIARYLRPLAGDGSQTLTDDAAYAFDCVLTKDLLVEGTHFLPTDPLDLTARKALRVNMSDLIAKGARPDAYLLGLVWPKHLGEASFETFCSGLAQEQADHGLRLLGGDTTVGDTLTISVTMFGTLQSQAPILRAGGQPGDLLVVTGTIGDSLLGLEAARKTTPADDLNALPYRLPQLPFAEAAFIAEHARAGLDVSDGLIADAQHLATASGVDIVIETHNVPLSDAGERASQRLPELLTHGDDYQTLFLIAPTTAEPLKNAQIQGLSLTTIGRAQTASGDRPRVIAIGRNGQELNFSRPGWDPLRSDELS